VNRINTDTSRADTDRAKLEELSQDSGRIREDIGKLRRDLDRSGADAEALIQTLQDLETTAKDLDSKLGTQRSLLAGLWKIRGVRVGEIESGTQGSMEEALFPFQAQLLLQRSQGMLGELAHWIALDMAGNEILVDLLRERANEIQEVHSRAGMGRGKLDVLLAESRSEPAVFTKEFLRYLLMTQDLGVFLGGYVSGTTEATGDPIRDAVRRAVMDLLERNGLHVVPIIKGIALSLQSQLVLARQEVPDCCEIVDSYKFSDRVDETVVTVVRYPILWADFSLPGSSRVLIVQGSIKVAGRLGERS
jgi:hypothetical protein